jgi:hypothetical protein
LKPHPSQGGGVFSFVTQITKTNTLNKNIDDKDYKLTTFSEEARAQLASLQQCTAHAKQK